MRGADESRTRGVRAVSPILSVQLLMLVLEVAYQFPRNESVHFAPGHDLLAASWRVEDLVFHGEPEESLETIDAVNVLAWCLPGILWRHLIVASRALKLVWRRRAVLMSFVAGANMVILECVGLRDGRDIDGQMTFRSA